MAIMDFVKAAGEALAGAVESLNEKSLHEKVKDSGLELKDLALKVNGDQVKIYAVVKDQETREKAVLLVGNTPGVAKVEDAIKVRPEGGQSTAAASKFHTVAEGETLSAIAHTYYGDANQYPKIFEANRPMLKDPDHIYPGQRLRIPS